MCKLTSLLIPAFLVAIATTLASALTLPEAVLIPREPTSADNLKLLLPHSCSGVYKGNAYVVSMAQNKITVARGQIMPVIQGGCPPRPREEIDLGRLPAGNYTLTVTNSAFENTPSSVLVENIPFTVSNARFAKQKPWVNLDYSGLWWDPTDAGSGLFIWQDVADNTFAAWFAYSADGIPFWYVFQPKWDTASATLTTDLIQTSRKPGSTSPPPNPTSNTMAGTASLDFTRFGTIATAEEGTLTITLKGQATRVINIQRFKP